jgi:hypothetical protein
MDAKQFLLIGLPSFQRQGTYTVKEIILGNHNSKLRMLIKRKLLINYQARDTLYIEHPRRSSLMT